MTGGSGRAVVVVEGSNASGRGAVARLGHVHRDCGKRWEELNERLSRAWQNATGHDLLSDQLDLMLSNLELGQNTKGGANKGQPISAIAPDVVAGDIAQDRARL
jgi:hypothetical protein